MAFFRRRAGSVAIFLISFVFIPIVLTKSCKKINNCECEMDDGSGVVSLRDLNNPDGKPRFTDIRENSLGSLYTYNYNPCTRIDSTGEDYACTGSNLCQKDSNGPTYYPCDASEPTFTVDESNHVVMTYKTFTYSGYTRTSEITLVCNKKQEKADFGNGITQTAGPGTSATYECVRTFKIDEEEKNKKATMLLVVVNIACPPVAATLTASSVCPGGSSGTASSPLSTGSIILIIFFPLVLLYLIVGILFNIYVRHKQSVPEVFPNHTFWADFPLLVKDGCVFSCGKMKYCCCVLYGKARGQEYQEI